mgnify:CR=1 FL=1
MTFDWLFFFKKVNSPASILKYNYEHSQCLKFVCTAVLQESCIMQIEILSSKRPQKTHFSQYLQPSFIVSSIQRCCCVKYKQYWTEKIVPDLAFNWNSLLISPEHLLCKYKKVRFKNYLYTWAKIFWNTFISF